MSSDHLDDTCITCGDVAVPLTVATVIDAGTAICTADDGGSETVATDLVGAVTVGDVVLVHAKVAIALLGDRDVEVAG